MDSRSRWLVGVSRIRALALVSISLEIMQRIFSPPDKVIGNTTIHSIQSGIIYGYAGLVDGVVARMRREMGTDPKIVATGGLAELIAGVTDSIDTVNRDLTLEGLRIISDEMNECRR